MSISDERSERGREKYDPWAQLVEHSEAAAAEGREAIARAMQSALDGPDWRRPAVLGAREGGPILDRFLAALEAQLRDLCACYDYRQLFLFSRLCMNLPVFKSREYTSARTEARGPVRPQARQPLAGGIHAGGRGRVLPWIPSRRHSPRRRQAARAGGIVQDDRGGARRVQLPEAFRRGERPEAQPGREGLHGRRLRGDRGLRRGGGRRRPLRPPLHLQPAAL